MVRDAAKPPQESSDRRTPAPRDNRRLFRIAVIVLLVIFAGLQYRIWVGNGSVAQITRINHMREALLQKNKKAQARNDAMEKEIADLKKSNQAAEGLARDEMGMIKPGETFFLTVPKNSPPVDGVDHSPPTN